MAASYIEMIQTVEPEGPYLLGGLCHAGLIAFEMARQLDANGHTVTLVTMIGPPAWNPPHWRWLKDAAAAVVRVAGGDADRATDVFLALRNRRMRVRQFCQYVRTWVEESASVPMRRRIEALNRLVKRLVSGAVVSEKPWAEPTFGTPPTSDEVLELYRRAVASYVRRPYRGRVALYWPEKVQINTLGGSPLTWSDASDRALGWRQIAAQVEVQPLPGDYTTSITTHVQTLADRIKTSIAEPYSTQRADTVRRVRRVAASWFSNRWLTSRVR
jgi:thioesterase domain-containing protein